MNPEKRPSLNNVEDSLVGQLLGPRKYVHEMAETENQVGVTTGLVWSELGETTYSLKRPKGKVVIFPKGNAVDASNLETESCEGLEVVLADDIKTIVARVIE